MKRKSFIACCILCCAAFLLLPGCKTSGVKQEIDIQGSTESSSDPKVSPFFDSCGYVFLFSAWGDTIWFNVYGDNGAGEKGYTLNKIAVGASKMSEAKYIGPYQIIGMSDNWLLIKENGKNTCYLLDMSSGKKQAIELGGTPSNIQMYHSDLYLVCLKDNTDCVLYRFDSKSKDFKVFPTADKSIALFPGETLLMATENGLYRLDEKADKMIRFANSNLVSSAVYAAYAGDMAYCAFHNDKRYSVERVNMKTGERKTLFRFEEVKSLAISEGILYISYFIQDGRIGFVKYDTRDNTVICNDKNAYATDFFVNNRGIAYQRRGKTACFVQGNNYKELYCYETGIRSCKIYGNIGIVMTGFYGTMSNLGFKVIDLKTGKSTTMQSTDSQ